MTMDAQTGQVSGSSVQIGNPIVEKGLVDVILPARDLRLYTAITDCGAGGLSSAVGEMSSGSGCDVDLTVVRLKYPGLAPWEIWLSEAQERMVLAVPPRNLAKIKELCDTYNVELTDIGVFTKTGRLIVRYKGKIVVDLANTFLHGGIPQRELKAVISDQSSEKNRISMAGEADKQRSGFSHNEMLLKLLAHPNISSKAGVIRSYDHEVQGGTVVKPLTGTGMDAPSDACVLKPPGVKGKVGIAIANGINPEYGKRDARRMAMAVMDEAVRNLVAVGVDPGRIAVLDNFCWGDPLREEMLGFLVEAARGCHDAALLFKTPFISGKDSLNNEYLGTDGQRHAIPPTLLISSIGIVPDVNKSVTMDLKTTGNVLYLVGEYAPVFGGSHFNLVCDRPFVESVPAVAQITPAVYRALYQCISGGYVRSAHDLSEGGIAVTAAEMCIGGRLGMEIELQGDEPERTLFGETTGCLLVEVHPEDIAKFESGFIHLPIMKIGRVTSGDVLKISCKGEIILTLPILSLIAAWNTPLQPAA
jgi:phosphoribosylformylglycinamidine synthase